MENDKELLPCPFCGHSPEISHGKVRCKNVKCPIQPKSVAWWDSDFYHKAINDWNARPAPKSEALVELPEKKELEFDCLGNPMPGNKYKEGFNEALDLCKLAIVRDYVKRD